MDVFSDEELCVEPLPDVEVDIGDEEIIVPPPIDAGDVEVATAAAEGQPRAPRSGTFRCPTT